MSDDFSNKAAELVNGERQSVYGSPYQNFSDIGRIWGAILNIPDIDPEQVALMMMGVKLARLKNKYHDDGIVDFLGYENCLAQIVEKKKENMQQSVKVSVRQSGDAIRKKIIQRMKDNALHRSVSGI